jgi:hypothetical protein
MDAQRVVVSDAEPTGEIDRVVGLETSAIPRVSPATISSAAPSSNGLLS